MTFEERMYLVKKRCWPKAQEVAGYLNSTGRGGKGSGMRLREGGGYDGMRRL